MSVVSQVVGFLHVSLFEISGQPVTVGALLAGLAVLVAARMLAALIGRTLLRMLGSRGVDDGVRFAIAKMTRYTIVVLGVLVAMATVGLRLDAVFAASAVLLVGIGFGLQTIAQNFVSGIIVLVERPVGRGDFVRIGDSFGSVMDIGLRATRIVTRDEVTIIVPNSELITGQVVNYSVPNPQVRVTVAVGVAYGSDTALVVSTLLEAANADPLVLAEPKPEVRFEAFGDSSLSFALLVWIAQPREDRLVASRLRFAIDAAFRKHGITIPFPQRDVHILSPRAAAETSRTS